ncbi:MAG: RNA-binding domain-containing protein [Fibrobacteria bacterium]
MDTTEKALESAIECGLLWNGPDACDGYQLTENPPTYLDSNPGGYKRAHSRDYDRSLCLLPKEALDFILATQPQEWERLKQHYGAETKDRFLQRLSREIASRGALDVLRNGIKDSGCKFQLAYFRPASGLNEETARLHAGNLFSVVRQLHYSEKEPQKSLDLVLFLNGIPLFTAELKNEFSGQSVADAKAQYKTTRDPREPLLAYRRCLAHFAVDPDWVFVTTELKGPATHFLPFNKGRFGGAGNPPVPPSQGGYATAYLWEDTWSRGSVLELTRSFIQEVEEEEEDDEGRKKVNRYTVFPRYQQLDAVRGLVSDARNNGAGKRYLIQHSAGSGKSLTIAWLAHRLSTLHDADNNRVFDSIVVITDRRILDRQLQSTMRQLEQTPGVVENIDTTSRQLKQALQEGKTIIVTTLQKFPAMLEQIRELAAQGKAGDNRKVQGSRFAVIVDEAHSSQSGDSPEALKRVFSSGSLEEAAKLEVDPEKDEEDRINESAEGRRFPPNMSVFAFTATPKPKTLQLFGVEGADGKFRPFHKYTMRQAIEEDFIRDVLENYNTYKAYWKLLKTIQDDPRYDKGKATYLLKSFVNLTPHAIQEKARVMVDHFAAQVQDKIDGKAKAMIVTRSRLHAVRFKLAVDKYFQEKRLPFKALVAFSDKVEDGGQSYTESGMNGVPEAQTARTFKRPEYRFLIVANKFQTGFDQPLLYAMYVDKKLGGVSTVQTLSRLNRTRRGKAGTVVLDFENEADDIKKEFETYYETTILLGPTDPNLLYDTQRRLLDFGVYADSDVDAFAKVFFHPKGTQDKLYALLDPIADRANALAADELAEFRGQLTDYSRLYAFLGQVMTFVDPELEKLYAFARLLRRKVKGDPDQLPLEIQQNIDLASYRLQQTASGNIALDRGNGSLEPMGTKPHRLPQETLEPLSRILADLNDRFGLNLGPEHKVTLDQMMQRLEEDRALNSSSRINPRETVQLTFDQKVEDTIQDIVDSNFDLYKRITDDKVFGDTVKKMLFDLYIGKHRQAQELIKQKESRTLEFKSSLRWSHKDGKEDHRVTHAALKTIAAFLNTEGGDLLLGVTDDGKVCGIEADQLENDDKFMLHLAQVVRNSLGDRSATCIDPSTQIVEGKTVCLVSCQRSPEPIFFKWKSLESSPEGDFYVRSGPGTTKLSVESAREYVRTRFGGSKLIHP